MNRVDFVILIQPVPTSSQSGVTLSNALAEELHAARLAAVSASCLQNDGLHDEAIEAVQALDEVLPEITAISQTLLA